MDILNVQAARSIWLFDTGLLNPQGASVNDLLPLLAEEYNFRVSPARDDSRSGQTMKFAEGVFNVDGQETEIALEIYNDGLIAESGRSTELCDTCLEGFLEWLGARLNVKYADNMVNRKMYRSEVVAAFDQGLAGLCNTLDRLAGTLSERLKSPQELTGLVFGSEDRPSNLAIERRIGQPFDQNTFFSLGHMGTCQHFEALRELEAVLTTPRPELD